MIETYPNSQLATSIGLEIKFSSSCPLAGGGKEPVPYGGLVTIEYTPHRKLVEFESLDRFVHTFEHHEVTLEELVSITLAMFAAVVDPLVATVTARAETNRHGPAVVQATYDGEFPGEHLAAIVDCYKMVFGHEGSPLKGHDPQTQGYLKATLIARGCRFWTKKTVAELTEGYRRRLEKRSNE